MAKKVKDITKTGALSYKDLQEMNNLNSNDIMVFTDDDLQDRLQKDKLIGSQQAANLVYSQNAKVSDYLESSPLMGQKTRLGGSDYYGRSTFDPDIIVGEQDWNNLSDVRAENQPWYSKIINGVGKAGVTAVTTFLEGTGLLYGGVHSLLETAGVLEDNGKSWLEDLWNNPLTNAWHRLNEASEDFMPNYYTRDEQENPWGHIFSANFIGDKLVKNLGFMVGAFYDGIPLAYGLGKLGTMGVRAARGIASARAGGMAARFGELTSGYSDDILGKVGRYGREITGLSDNTVADIGARYGEDVTGLYRKLAQEGLTEGEKGRRMLEGLDRINSIANTTRAVTQTVGVVGSAVNEGAIEALNNSGDWAELKKQEADAKHNSLMEEIEERYGGMDTPEAIDEKMAEAERYQQELAAIEKGRAEVGNADLLMNLPILIASNAYQLGRLYTRGFDTTSRSLTRFGKKLDTTRRETGSIWNGHKLSGSLEKGTLATDKKTWKGVLSALYKSNTEGVEEITQKMAADAAGNAVDNAIARYMNSGNSEESKTNVDDYIAGMGKAISDNLRDPKAWEEYFIGAVSSLVGMPVFGSQTKNAYLGKGRAVGLQGGFFGNLSEYREAMENEDRIAKYLNGRVKDPKFKALYDNLKVQDDYERWMQEQIDLGDKAEFKTEELEAFYKDITTAASSGHLEEFKALVGYNKEYSDAELEHIVEQTSRVISPEVQKARDEETKNYLEGAIKAASDNGEDALVADYQKELEEVVKRLEDDASGRKKYQKKLEGPFIDRNGQMNVTDPDKMREILERNRRNLLQGIDEYLKIRNDIDIETDGRLSDDEISTLTMMRGHILDHDRRSADMVYDIVSNLRNARKYQESWKKSVQEALGRVEPEYDKASKSLEKARKEGADEDRIKELEEKKDKAEKKVAKVKAEINKLDEIISLLDKVGERHDTTMRERMAESEGRGNNIFRRVADAFDFHKTRDTNTDELLALLANPENARLLTNVILNRTPGLDDFTRQRMAFEVADMFRLAHEKLDYNKKLREFMKDPTLLKDVQEKNAAMLTQQEIDNSSDELAFRIRNAESMTELHGIMKEAYAQNRDVAKAALQKAKQLGSDEQKQFLDEYEKALKFYGDFSVQASQLPPEINGKIHDGALSAWEYALGSGGNVYDTFISEMQEAADALDNTGLDLDKAQADAIRKILKDLNAAIESSATNKRVKEKEDDSQDAVEKQAKKTGGLAAFMEQHKASGKAVSSETSDTLTKDIEEAVRKSKKDGQYTVFSKDDLPKQLRDRIDAFMYDKGTGEAIPGHDIDVDAIIFSIVSRLTDDDIIRENGYDIKDGHNTPEMGDMVEGSSRAQEMKDLLRTSFKSDYPTQFVVKLDYRLPFTDPEKPYLQPILKMLQKYKAYQFVDKNYLGYVAMHYGGHPTIHFLRSTDASIHGEKSTDPITFVAIKWDKVAQNAVLRHGFNSRDNVNLMDEVAPVTIGEEQYQIVGVLSFDSRAEDEISTAFANLQNKITGELSPKMEAARESNQPFVVSDLTTEVEEIFTGRLEKNNDKDDDSSKTKVSLHEFMTDKQGNPDRRTSTEWESGMDFYFGIIVNGFTYTTDKEEITDRIVYPNDDWKSENNGAIVLFLPKPDGRLYPVRCTRRTVGKWLISAIDTEAEGNHSGQDLLDDVLAGRQKNEYLNNITDYLRMLLNPDSTVADRMKAKFMLSKYFIFGKESPIHFNESSVSLTFSRNTEEIEGDTFEEQVQSFFKILAKNNVMFTLPTNIREEVNGRDVIDSGVFEIGMRGFYNINANFTIAPIDTDGRRIQVVSGDSGSNDTGGSPNITRLEFDLGDGMKSYTVDGDVFLDGEKVSVEKQNLILMAMEAEAGRLPSWASEKIPALYSEVPAIGEYVLSNMQSLQGVYVIHADGQDWVYDSRKANHNERLYRLTPEIEKEFMQEVRKFTSAPENMETIMKLKADKGGNAGSSNTAGTSEWVYNPDVAITKTIAVREFKEPYTEHASDSLVARSENPKMEATARYLNGTMTAREYLRAMGYSTNRNSLLGNPSTTDKEISEEANRISERRKKYLKHKGTGASGSSSQGRMFAGKSIEELNDKGTPLEILLASKPNDGIFKKVFAALQYAEENGITINHDRVYSILTGSLNEGKAKRKEMIMDLINEIKDCH